MTLSDADRTAAKVEEVDRMIAHLQKRRRELLTEVEAPTMTPQTPKKDTPESKASVRPERPAQPGARASEPAKGKDALERTLDSLPWKSFKKKEGEWAFLRDREGRLVDELQSQRDFVDKARKEGQVVVGKYRYQVSEDKFLNRYYAGA
jgi:hypothetical protein